MRVRRSNEDGGSGDEPDALGQAVGRAQLGDSAAFIAVYRRVHPLLLRYLRTQVGQDADDVASETWLQISRDLAGFHGDGDAFRGWAATIARNRAKDHVRASRRRPAQSYEELEDGASGSADRRAAVDPESLVLDSQATRDAVRLIASLPKEQAEALLLRVVMDLDVEAAARVLGKRPGAVRTASHRGLRTLAGRLPGTDPPPSPSPLGHPSEVVHST